MPAFSQSASADHSHTIVSRSMIQVLVRAGLDGSEVKVDVDGMSTVAALRKDAIAKLSAQGVPAAKRCIDWGDGPDVKRARMCMANCSVVHEGVCLTDMQASLAEAGIVSHSIVRLAWSFPQAICGGVGEHLHIFDKEGETVCSPINTGVQIHGVTFYEAEVGLVLVSAHCDGTVMQWNPVTGERVGRTLCWSHPDHSDGCFGSLQTYTTEAGTFIIARFQGNGNEEKGFEEVLRLNTATGEPMPYMGENGAERRWGNIGCMAVFQNKMKPCLVIGSERNPLFLHDAKTGERDEKCTFHDSQNAQLLAVYSHGGVLFVAATLYESPNTVTCWNCVTGGAPCMHLTGHEDSINALSTYETPSGKAVIVAGASDSSIRQWDVETGAAMGEPWFCHSGQFYGIHSYPAGEDVILVTCDYNSVRCWSATTGADIGSTIMLEPEIDAIATFRLPL